MLDISETAKVIANKLWTDMQAGKLKTCGIDEVRDAIAEHIYPEVLGSFRAAQLETMTLRRLINKVG